MENQRTASREKVLKPGMIEFGGNAVPCIVRNVSEAGASLNVTSPFAIPDFFTLVLTLDGQRHPAWIIWRKDMQIGIAFELAL
ncbi:MULTISPECIES: PilZ domain-containing protein [unclassified Bradyrhizobium]|jgi:PilZ domain|uniref:PilZ domain-containing protein n=1 Tax=unclassified Bradyrhizobium TaxID=2631580 RepID=UPI002111CC35|nr:MULTISPECIES: PilZ domain-containing protein [unclassified Bradyrhizobium]MCK1319031.1 PilZ domain-containing protein [Bradyrhizobium sp. 23]MCK1465825.1 PilZ domain-containing protein [Bradyrhizobium sp. CW10]